MSSQSDLDEKLKEALQAWQHANWENREGYATGKDDRYNKIMEEAIAQIHQAYKDEGYVHPKIAETVRHANKVLMNERMTGQEWYSRIDKDLLRKRILGTAKTFNEFTKPELILELLYQHFDEAAKRASGLEEQSLKYTIPTHALYEFTIVRTTKKGTTTTKWKQICPLPEEQSK